MGIYNKQQPARIGSSTSRKNLLCNRTHQSALLIHTFENIESFQGRAIKKTNGSCIVNIVFWREDGFRSH